MINVLIFCVSTFICCVFLEFSVRIFLPIYNPSGMVRFYLGGDDLPLAEKNFVGRQWNSKGDYNVAVMINKFGFRDKKDLRMSTANDLFVVGDSFSFGFGVEEKDRYSNLLESKLGVPIYNISIPTDFDGYEKIVKYAQQNGAPIKNLLIGVCMENDLYNYDSHIDEIYFTRKGRDPFASVKGYLGLYSAAYNALASVVHHNTFLTQMAIKLGFVVDNYDGMYQQTYSENVLKSSTHRLVKLIKDRHVPNVVVVIIPSRALWVGDNITTQLKMHNDFVRLLEEIGLEVIDLRFAFEDGGDPLQYHFRNDPHWNNKGHLKVSEVISAYFRAKETLKIKRVSVD